MKDNLSKKLEQTGSFIISIEGLDGSGKTTQSKLLFDAIKDNGFNTQYLDYPDYDNESSTLVKMYLQGKIDTDPNNVNPYAASTFYAADRYISYKTHWENTYKNDKAIFISNRYISSNIIHQMSKLDKSKWDSFIDWVMDLECEKYGIPDPTLVIYLDVPIEISQDLMNKRYDNDTSKKDIHEANIKYLSDCREAALYAAEKLGWITLNCSINNEIMPASLIQKSIQLAIKNYLWTYPNMKNITMNGENNNA